ncbi:DUF3987 domain-containing protein [filamentous cyanobacterium LEGE 11480]|uniref:DUF3987 domain-containing protein n=1 Tax=Romeriopsis navalis LEGE 11480 TaxID=2777977 RepID=A0A928VVX0_9CYAN|nr:YfjI family protein [Romeriopsis navalis]MBE9033024.1 DUF3987 domain-containing protein [Romeriopsis navalis LEGE 11480]
MTDALVDCKISELAIAVKEGSETPARAQMSLQNWCREHKLSSFSASQVLKEKFAELGIDTKIGAIKSGNLSTDIESLDQKMIALLNRNVKGFELSSEKVKLRQSSGLSEREFEQLWQSTESDYNTADSEEWLQVHSLLKAKRSSVALASVLPAELASPLGKVAKMQNLRDEVYLISLLTAIGSLAQNGTSLLLHKGLDFEVTPNIYGAIVAPPSQKKSPVLKTVVTRPLKQLTKEAKESYKKSVAAWSERKAQAAENDEIFTEDEPSREIYYFTNATGEAILQQVNHCPNRGLLALTDELAGAFKSRNQYRGGKGSDAEDMLSFYDGMGGLSLRVDGVRNEVSGLFNYGVLGSIQPGVLQRFLGNCQDENGAWARFIFINQPIAASTLPDDWDDWDVSDMLTGYYRRIAQYAPERYRLTSEAFKQFQSIYNALEQRRESETNPALQAVIGKTTGRIGKITLSLHLLEAAVARKAPAQEIGVETLLRAVKIAELAIEQIEAIYGECNPEDQLSPAMARIVEVSRRKGEVTARQISQALPGSQKMKAPDIRQCFIKLANQGFGEVAGEGNKLTFTAYEEPKELPPPEPQPGDAVELISDQYQIEGLQRGSKYMVVKVDQSEPTEENPCPQLFATVMDEMGQNYRVWIAHLRFMSHSEVS